jgi:hypothetical protein
MFKSLFLKKRKEILDRLHKDTSLQLIIGKKIYFKPLTYIGWAK